MDYIAYIALFLPLLGFLILTFSGGRLFRKQEAFVACSVVFLSFLLFSTLFLNYIIHQREPFTLRLFSWIPIAGIQADFSLFLDPLSQIMALIVTGVGFLIHVYSIGYMEEETSWTRYFACLNFFIFAMLLLVLASHLLLFFMGWEAVGLASYLLIGYWYERSSAAAAATKAFVMNRIGDLGLLLGLLLTFHLFGTGEIQEVLRKGENLSQEASLLTLLTLLYFIGATGKSAQFPLHTWLPDAMEGPTPVSALIHAATMVTAGVYLIIRLYPLFLLAPDTLYLIAWIGAGTSLGAALSAMGQTDLKRVLAYSTVSQLGLMFLACGVGAFYAAFFHLTTHAFIKALLFLSAGNIVHRMHTTEMEHMGGLSKIFRKTDLVFLVGVLAMSGIPPLAAFFSKDLILEEVSHQGFQALFLIGITVSLLTAFYLTRAYCLTFKGKQRFTHTPEEASPVMLRPLFILMVLSILGGFLGYSFYGSPPLQKLLSQIGIKPMAQELGLSLFLQLNTWLAIGAATLGILLSFLLYTQWSEKLKPPLPLFKTAFFIDTLYNKLFVFPLKKFAYFVTYGVEPHIFEKMLSLSTQGTNRLAIILQGVQSGQIRSYVAWMAAGMVLLTLYFVF